MLCVFNAKNTKMEIGEGIVYGKRNMIQIPPQSKVFTIPEPLFFDNSIDSIIAVCKKNGLDHFSRDIFVFRDEK